MRTFVLRARAAPTDSQTLMDNVGGDAHSEILAHSLMNAIFVAQSHRPDVVVHLVLESTQDYSRTIKAVESGITVRTLSFEKLVKALAEDGHQLYMMDPKGESIRELAFAENPCFLLTDHIPMPKKTFNSLKRLGAEKISLGPRMLFASQCVVLIQNELDLAGM